MLVFPNYSGNCEKVLSLYNFSYVLRVKIFRKELE